MPRKSQPDPSKPYKAYAAAISGVLGTVLAQSTDMPWWAVGLVAGGAAGAGAFAKSNPAKKTRNNVQDKERGVL